jgi:hypothetical protein
MENFHLHFQLIFPSKNRLHHLVGPRHHATSEDIRWPKTAARPGCRAQVLKQTRRKKMNVGQDLTQDFDGFWWFMMAIEAIEKGTKNRCHVWKIPIFWPEPWRSYPYPIRLHRLVNGYIPSRVVFTHHGKNNQPTVLR